MANHHKDYFSGIAAQYARFRPHYPDTLFDWLSAIAPSRNTAWDCAAGNGQCAVPLARRFSQVIATDISQAQLDKTPKVKNIELRACAAEECVLQENSIDLITVAQGLHWFDLPAFFKQVDRCLVNRGILAIWCYGLFSVGPDMDDIFYRYYNETVGPYWPAERRLVEQGYRGIELPYTEIQAPQFEMTLQWSMRELLGYIGSWSASTRYVSVEKKDPLKVLEQQLIATWGDPDNQQKIKWPLSMRVCRK